MGSMPDRDKDVFSNAEKTVSRGFTERELRRIHELAIELEGILNSMIHRDYCDDSAGRR